MLLTTTNLSFSHLLFRDYDSGGLNLNAGHFAQLSEFVYRRLYLYADLGFEVALMCLAQIVYQFYLYP